MRDGMVARDLREKVSSVTMVLDPSTNGDSGDSAAALAGGERSRGPREIALMARERNPRACEVCERRFGLAHKSLQPVRAGREAG